MMSEFKTLKENAELMKAVREAKKKWFQNKIKIYSVGCVHKHLHFPTTGTFLLGSVPQSVSIAVQS